MSQPSEIPHIENMIRTDQPESRQDDPNVLQRWDEYDRIVAELQIRKADKLREQREREEAEIRARRAKRSGIH